MKDYFYVAFFLVVVDMIALFAVVAAYDKAVERNRLEWIHLKCDTAFKAQSYDWKIFSSKVDTITLECTKEKK